MLRRGVSEDAVGQHGPVLLQEDGTLPPQPQKPRGVTARLSATACHLSDGQEQGLKSESYTENLTALRTVVCPAC